VPDGLPVGSHAYVYEYSKANGKINGKICALMESAVATATVGRQACAGSGFVPGSDQIIDSLTITTASGETPILDSLTIEAAP